MNKELRAVLLRNMVSSGVYDLRHTHAELREEIMREASREALRFNTFDKRVRHAIYVLSNRT